MTGPERETPLSWLAEGGTWPEGPFTPPPGTTHDLVVVEQLAMLAAEIKRTYPLGRRTQSDVEDAADIGRSQLSRYINGREFPSLDSLLRLTAALGFRVSLAPWVVSQGLERAAGAMPERLVWPERVQQPVHIENAYSRRRRMPRLPAGRGRLRERGSGGP